MKQSGARFMAVKGTKFYFTAGIVFKPSDFRRLFLYFFMTEAQLDFIIELHETLDRQGPGSDWETLKALEVSGLKNKPGLQVLDLGCGTGSQTRVLAENLKGIIYALDLFERFIDQLRVRLPVPNVKPLTGSMDDLPFNPDTFDLIWSEGAIYNMGFANGLNYLRPFLKKNGVIALSEITWLTEERPRELEDYWNAEYPEIATAEEKIRVIGTSGYKLLDYFILSEGSWIDNYYRPLEQRLRTVEEDSTITPDLMDVVKAYQGEIDLYKKYKKYYGYGFYVAQNNS